MKLMLSVRTEIWGYKTITVVSDDVLPAVGEVFNLIYKIPCIYIYIYS